MFFDRHVVYTVPALFNEEGTVVGGAERYALELAKQMAKRTRTTLITFGNERQSIDINELKIEIFRPLWKFQGSRFNPFSLAIIPLLFKAKIIHCHQRRIVLSSFCALFGRLFGKRVYVTDLGGDMWDISYRVPIHKLFHGNLHISRFSKKIHEGSETAEPHIVIGGGVDTDVFHPSVRPSRNSALFVGRIRPLKGLDDLVEAVDDDIPLRIIGRPFDPEFCRSLKERSPESVSFEHDRTDEEVALAYQEARVVILPSVYRTSSGEETKIPELLGLCLLEAMSSGTPVIATNVGALSEIVRDGENGFLIPPNDPHALREKILWLFDHPCEAEQMGRNGRTLALHHQWGDVVQRCVMTYSAQGASARKRLIEAPASQ